MSTPRSTRSHPNPTLSSGDGVPTLPSHNEQDELTPLSEEDEVIPTSADHDSTPPVPDIQAQMLQLFQTLAANQAQLQEVLAQQQQPRYTSRSPDYVPGGTPRDPNVQDPDTFSGSRDALNGFLTQVQLVFDLQPRRFPNDNIKISYVIAKFRGTPLNAIRPYLAYSEDDKPDWLKSYDNFVEYLRRNYGDPDEKGTAERKLQSLVQKGSASSYFADFQQYSAVLGWEDAPLVSMAIRGLKDELKDQLVLIGDRPKTLSSLIDIVVRLDNRLWERKQEKRGDTRISSDNLRSSTARSAIQSTTTTTYQTRGTDRPPFVARGQSPQTSNSRQSSPPSSAISPGMPRRLTDEEKQRRRDQGLCLFCGQAGHIATNCPATGRSSITSSTYTSSRPSSNTSTHPSTTSTRYEQSKVSAPPK